MSRLPSPADSASPPETAATCDVGLLLARLKCREQSAWEDFLLRHSAVLYQAAEAYTRDQDTIADCFVYVCEQLAKDDFRRLLRFEPGGAASFTTWLRVVARNLCLDWHRKMYGRFRPFKSLQGFSARELEVFRCRYERNLSRDETLQMLKQSYPSTTEADLSELEARIERALSPLQRWLLSSRRGSTPELSVPIAEDDEAGVLDVIDRAPSPEAVALNEQQRSRVRKSLRALSADERLLLKFRFEDELSLEEIARLMVLGDAQRAHRRLAAVLQKLRHGLTQPGVRKSGAGVREIEQGTK